MVEFEQSLQSPKSNLLSSRSRATNKDRDEPSSGATGRFTFAVTEGNFPCHVIENLKKRGNWSQVDKESAIQVADFFWKQINFNFKQYDELDERLDASARPFMFNHLEVNRGICTKTMLIKSLTTYYENLETAVNAKYTVFDTTPTTFVIARNVDDHEINRFMHRFREISRGGSKYERVPLKHCTSNMWLVKPASLNQGRGIEIFKNMRDISEFIFQKN